MRTVPKFPIKISKKYFILLYLLTITQQLDTTKLSHKTYYDISWTMRKYIIVHAGGLTRSASRLSPFNDLG